MQKVFFTCGPSQLYPTVERHIADALKNNILSISHRGSQFMELYEKTVSGLKTLMSIPEDYEVFFISSGTEAMERIIQNCVLKKSGHVVQGAFGKRWLTASRELGKTTEDVTVAEGEMPDLSRLQFSKDVELICVTQNETSSGAMFDPKEIAKLRVAYPLTLIGVDIVSSAPTVKLDFKSADCVFFSVQKGFGLPAGLGVLVVSPHTMAKSREVAKKTSIGTYHSFVELKKYADKKHTPETPNVLALYLLQNVIDDFLKIGIDKLRAQTRTRAEKFYAYVAEHKAYAPVTADAQARSITTMVVSVSGGSSRVIDALKAQGIIVSSGYGDNKEKHIRIGNFPAHTDADFERLLAGLSDFDFS